MTAADYPVTQPYGYDPSYPLNNGQHLGIDYGCPTGTPVVVNGVTIGLSGSTGASTGPHLHVGRWVGGKATDPTGGGFQFTSATVTQVASDPTNGHYVRIQADGASWVYLHLSAQNVTVGQELEGGDVADKITPDISKILQHGILARNGVSGRPYALDDPDAGAPWVGGELTADFIREIFNSTEARQWRDSEEPDSVKGVNKRLADGDDNFVPVGELYVKK